MSAPQSRRIVSINVGQPREIEVGNRRVLTSIFKTPVYGKVALRRYNVQGDRQSDLRVHGGPSKAVYSYSSEHYPFWAEQLPGTPLPVGAFGENLTTEGMLEEDVHIGDVFRAGSAILKVTQPRMPCYKLAIRMNRSDMVKRFWASGRSGTYFSIVEEGEFESGDPIEPLESDPRQLSVADVVRLHKRETDDPDLFSRAMEAPLSGSWKHEIRERWAQMAF
ncbi:MAG: MOSC domain-containing protein [Acidobacteriaceae bacterium]|nr:MOSC domain-containing protein [Acidobacteriaceae bacterium]